MAEEMDSNMRQFLSDRRLSIADLAKKASSESSETAAERRERLRALAIGKREAELSQLRMEDRYETQVQENFALLTNLHEACFTKCGRRDDVSYLTMAEGICFRNCLNKFNTWYPRLGEQTQDAAFKTYWGLTQELEQEVKKN
mmetsp:Transcript_42014/g.55357  ORF Transcript_42014/g.55357 Transcript_42014/m.55357 type:complete len:143 (-) Transcript_42014:156-584(-)|eukprot:CAMPEP_0185578100 /NCGR_PEP_ID=MMETSP0434-20130131/12064_1 /TAXON_ID=626734 ORGANISM="Favella taraikaensis, Strain Fe Narragansett Bay" /NCGR_SAMPLE_ID=MMETSP0434 /ASSEMBLY_ACC=CAM_ASM_000379 /LENGTH=142 /DNA_ID=CAMNT_0028195841 /DNA_START=22 /DNA_END=450 /DNA_ORIENTATION=+